ncbi:hypothetical protein AYI70_g3679, partial [Smittium culicis]
MSFCKNNRCSDSKYWDLTAWVGSGILEST